MNKNNKRVLIIGGGVISMNIAKILAHKYPKKSISLIEKEKRMSYKKKPREAFYRNELQVVDENSIEPSSVKTQSEANTINASPNSEPMLQPTGSTCSRGQKAR